MAEPEVSKEATAEPEQKGGPPSPGRKKKKRDANALRKAPQAPKRFKSSYICFFMAKQDEIKEELGTGAATVTEVSKRSAELWRNLPADERAYWDEVANKDKQRYMAEKATYTGPWQVPHKRAKKDPSAPKRPMSAFLYFSQERRKLIKDKHPEMRNTEVSQELGREWREASEEERRPHIELEAKEREKYKVAIAKWKEEQAEKKEAEKKALEEQRKLGMQAYSNQAGDAPPQQPPPHSAPPPPPHYGGYMPPPPQGWQPPPYSYYPPPPGPGGEQGAYPPPPMYSSYPPPPPPHSSGQGDVQDSSSGKSGPQVLGPTGMPQHPPPYHYPYPPHPAYSHPPPPPNYYDQEGSGPPAPYPFPGEPEPNEFQDS